MTRFARRLSGFEIWSLGFVLVACASLPQPTPTLPREAPHTLTPSASAAPTPPPADTGWVAVSPGFDRRELTVPLPVAGLAERVILFRLDPALFDFHVWYTPGFPRFVSQWDAGARARLVFNAGFFDDENGALGLLVSDGRSFGQSYVGFGGMFAVDGSGTLSLRSLAAQPYQPGESLAQVVQSFPMLICPDGSTYAKPDPARARRTALGQDAAGRVCIVVAPHAAFTLAELAAWLRASDLGLVIALNLDGGGSTGYSAGPNDRLDSLAPVPAVIAVYARP